MGKIDIGKLINVTVEQFLPDIILVSFMHDEKLFQGILLDSTKRQFPCGVYPSEFMSANGELKDSLYSLGQRFSYQDESSRAKNIQEYCLKKSKAPKRKKNAPMTVRLRPRQVLCSNCQSICNENMQNVSSERINDKHSIPINPSLDKDTAIKKPNNNNFYISPESCKLIENTKYLQSSSQSLVPKLIKLKASDIQTATSNGISSLSTNSTDIFQSSSQNQTIISPCPSNKSDLDNNLGKLPVLKLAQSKRKRRIPRMTITTNSEAKECTIITRSRRNVDDCFNQSAKNRMSSFMNVNSSLKYEKENNTNICTPREETEGNNIVSIKENISESTSLLSSESYDSFKVVVPPSKESTSVNSELILKLEKSERMNLRKKRSVGMMEDLWDETIFDETKRIKNYDKNGKGNSEQALDDNSNIDLDKNKTNSVRVLKISYGPGKATVLKIHPKSSESEHLYSETPDSTEPPEKPKSSLTKAAKKALKRARKAALRRSSKGSFHLPVGHLECKSPRPIGCVSPAHRSAFRPVSRSFVCSSPGRFSNSSPVRFGGASPGRFSGASPGRFGSGSPRRFVGSSVMCGIASPRLRVDGLLHAQTKRHKHKVKHKKKRKDEKKYNPDENVEPNSCPTSLSSKIGKASDGESYNLDDVISEKNNGSTDEGELRNNTTDTDSNKSLENEAFQNTRHKLSISIKRVNNASYITCDPNSPSDDDLKPNIDPSTNDESNADAIKSFDSSFNVAYKMSSPCGENFNYLNVSPEREFQMDISPRSDEMYSRAPDFPFLANTTNQDEDEATKTFMTLECCDVDSCELSEDFYRVGDVVWGKANTIPWWPAKITNLKMKNASISDKKVAYHAQVCWYGSSSLTLLPVDCLQHFLTKFKVRYRKNGEAIYQKAVREANLEAMRQIKGSSPSQSICESPVTSSPRQVDVVS